MNIPDPIYVKKGSLGTIERAGLATATGRPVVEVRGDPARCVLDQTSDLRDKFACAALSGLGLHLEKAFMGTMTAKDCDLIIEDIVNLCDRLAAAMMAKRDERP